MDAHSFSLRNVKITSTFWRHVQDCSREKSIPAIIEAQKTWNHWTCLTWAEGHEPAPHQFWDSDIYKLVEAACYFLITHPNDSAMRAAVDDAVEMIQHGQHDDGYIGSYYTVRGIQGRWTNLRDNHELYCMGHLLEAVVAYETLTGNGKLLAVAQKMCQYLSGIFGAHKKRGYPGHQEIEIGLLRMYELTKDELYFKLAEFFVLERGQKDDKDEIYFDKESFARGADPYDFMGTESKTWMHGPRDYAYQQCDQPLLESTEVKGHAVRAMYFYTAATDLARLTSDTKISKALDTALQRLWRDLIDTKIYITGGIGSHTQNEGFGQSYRLSDLECDGCYAETCACFALINWCQRLLWRELDGEVGDIMELALYNGFLGAVSQAGDAFYYQNVLRTRKGQPKERSKWFGVACCPPNVAKLLGSLGRYIYSKQSPTLIAIHQYIASKLDVPGQVTITQAGDMPWTGKVSVSVRGTTDLALRIPQWAKDWTCSVSGQLINGYLHLKGVKDAEIQLDFPISPRKLYAHPRTDKDEICISRGPLVYCLEDVDNVNSDIDNVGIVEGAAVQDGEQICIGGLDHVVSVKASGRSMKQELGIKLYCEQPWVYEKLESDLVAIPYFLRSNRGGEGTMRVWAPRLSSA